eukprot:767329-Hanusia_phi.AAC.1
MSRPEHIAPPELVGLHWLLSLVPDQVYSSTQGMKQRSMQQERAIELLALPEENRQRITLPQSGSDA